MAEPCSLFWDSGTVNAADLAKPHTGQKSSKTGWLGYSCFFIRCRSYLASTIRRDHCTGGSFAGTREDRQTQDPGGGAPILWRAIGRRNGFLPQSILDNRYAGLA